MTEIQDELQDELLEDNEERRATLVEKLNQKPEGAFGADDLAKPITPYRARVAGETLREYREIEYLYYQGLLDDRWNLYLSGIEKEMLKQFEFGGMIGVANLAKQGYFDIPVEAVQYDLYNIESNSSMKYLLEVGIPIDDTAQAIAGYLESGAWRSAARAGEKLSTNPLWKVNGDIQKLVNEGMARSQLQPGFGRKEFVELLSSPLDGSSPITGQARARMIARTEATRARGAASTELADALRSQGYIVVETWRIAMNTNVCPDCEALDGHVKGDGWLDPPPLHPNCDCDVDIEILNG
jgi:hypothetical protein